MLSKHADVNVKERKDWAIEPATQINLLTANTASGDVTFLTMRASACTTARGFVFISRAKFWHIEANDWNAALCIATLGCREIIEYVNESQPWDLIASSRHSQ